MGRKRKLEHEKKVSWNLSVEKQVKEEFIKLCKERGVKPSNIIEDHIKEYLSK